MDTHPLVSILEAAMLTCFGFAWPVSCLRMLHLRSAEGRGLVPTALVLCGYCAGIGAKLCLALSTGSVPLVLWLYLLNATSVAVNLVLQWHFGRRQHQPASVMTRTPETMAAAPAAGRR